MLPPVIMASLPAGRDSVRNATLTQLSLTHDSRKLASYADVSMPRKAFGKVCFGVGVGVGMGVGVGVGVGVDVSVGTIAASEVYAIHVDVSV